MKLVAITMTAAIIDSSVKAMATRCDSVSCHRSRDRARRMAVGLHLRSEREAVAHTPHRLDRVAQRAQLLAQPQDGIVDRAVALDGWLAPDAIVQVCPAERASTVAQQQVQQAELGPGQVQRLAAEPRQMRGWVELERAEPQGGRAFRAIGGHELL